MSYKAAFKQILGELPLTAEVYWQLRQGGKPVNRSFSLERLEKCLPEWRVAVENSRIRVAYLQGEHASRKVLLFAELHYWIEHAVLLGMALAGLGHDVTLDYLPYPNWSKSINRFDLRQHSAYSRGVLGAASPYINCQSLLDVRPADNLPAELVEAIQEISLRDVQYTLQVEDVDLNSELYHLRLEPNTQATRSFLSQMQGQRPDIVLTPNGSILEMGVLYRVARFLDVPVVTYEFGEQRGRIWLGQNTEVMFQETSDLWEASKHLTLTQEQWEQIRDLFGSRQRADLWENFARRWQGLPNQGEAQVRRELGLDLRPVVLLTANVIGDSLTLGRQVFTNSMTEWLQHAVRYYSNHPETQLVVRIHPGERYTQGPSVADVIHQVLPDIPEHIHLVEAGDLINTYDLIEIADLGLVYTTTVGMEMAMSGVPVIVAGETHYRGKGFTLDPETWESYTRLLGDALDKPEGYRLSKEQVELAWNYAYRFFFEYPQPFPWHLLGMWDELQDWSLERVLSEEGQFSYRDTFCYLLGDPIPWGVQALLVSGDSQTT